VIQFYSDFQRGNGKFGRSGMEVAGEVMEFLAAVNQFCALGRGELGAKTGVWRRTGQVSPEGVLTQIQPKLRNGRVVNLFPFYSEKLGNRFFPNRL